MMVMSEIWTRPWLLGDMRGLRPQYLEPGGLLNLDRLWLPCPYHRESELEKSRSQRYQAECLSP